MTSLLSGAAFGAALVTAGVYKPSVIISQVKFENYHMIQAFLAATASSTLVVALLDKGYAQCKPRSASPLGFFSRYDGNIIGGSILGIGMALSGACPGTALVQAAVGIRSGWHALDGAVLAGIAWVGFIAPLIEHRKKKNPPGEPTTVYEDAHIPRSVALIGFEAVCAAIIAATVLYTPPSPFSPLVAPFLGGILIGGAQLFSLLSRRCLVGVSTVYEDIGKHFWWLLRGADTSKAPSGYNNLMFSAGVMGGAYALAQAVPQVAENADIGVNPLVATAGGALIVLGARMAGGCTSGHGISGISLLSTSSFLTIISLFGAAALVAPYVH